MTEQTPTAPSTESAPTAAAGAQLTPPAEAAELTLAKPEAVTAVAPAASAQMVPLDAAVLPGLDKMAAEYVDSLVTLDEKTPEFTAKTESIRTMGDDDIRAAAEVSNRLLESPVKDMGKGGFSEGA